MHGAEPHLCHYSGCDRAVPGNGFPRKYNLYDHMRRVHEHMEPMTPDHAPSPAVASQATAQHNGRQPRRRKNSREVDRPERRLSHGVTKSLDAGRASANRANDVRLRRQKQLQDDFSQGLAMLSQTVSAVEGPQDASSIHLISENAVKLEQIAREFYQYPEQA